MKQGATDAIDERDARRAQANAANLTNSANSIPSVPGQPQNLVFQATLSLEERDCKSGRELGSVRRGKPRPCPGGSIPGLTPDSLYRGAGEGDVECCN